MINVTFRQLDYDVLPKQKETWDKYTSDENIDLDEIASHMSEFGIWYRFLSKIKTNIRKKKIIKKKKQN